MACRLRQIIFCFISPKGKKFCEMFYVQCRSLGHGHDNGLSAPQRDNCAERVHVGLCFFLARHSSYDLLRELTCFVQTHRHRLYAIFCWNRCRLEDVTLAATEHRRWVRCTEPGWRCRRCPIRRFDAKAMWSGFGFCTWNVIWDLFHLKFVFAKKFR